VAELMADSFSAMQPPTQRRRIFRREGNYWTIGFSDSRIHLRHTKGLALIAILLHHPGCEFHCSDLLRMVGRELDFQQGRGAIEGELAIEPAIACSDPPAEEPAKRSYRERLVQLRNQLDDAEVRSDSMLSSRLEEQMVLLSRELARAVGLYGPDPALGSRAERDRLRITNSIKYVIPGIVRHYPQIGTHLQRAIRTGRYCSYAMQPGEALDWQL